MPKHTRQVLVLILLLGWAHLTSAVTAQDDILCTFKNPILAQGQDPSVIYYENAYYLVQSNNADYTINIREAETLTGLGAARPVTIWAAPPNTMYSRNIWAPELLALDDGLFIYFAADDGNNDNHRTYVLQAATDDPMGAWEFKGALFTDPALDKWSIDFSVFEYDEQLYGVWSGSQGDVTGAAFPQVIYIAAMSDPLTITSDRVEIITPTESWETKTPLIAEGPQPYVYEDTVSIVYSANPSWMRHYLLGRVTLTGDDPLDPADWTKVGPIFAETVTDVGAVYGVGHNSNPVPSPDGEEWWQVYHAKVLPQDGWDDRNIRIQEMTWNPDGTPNLGTPLPAQVAQAVPAGESCGVQATFSFNTLDTDDGGTPVVLTGDPVLTADAQGTDTANLAVSLNGDDVIDVGRPLVSTTGSYTIIARARLTEAKGDFTLVAQEGGLFSAFRLHTTAEGHFAFTTYDDKGAVAAQAIAPVPATAETWYTVAAVRDALAGEIMLYINGEQVAAAPFNQDWSTARSTVMGAAKEKGKRQHFLIGTLDDVALYNGALSAAALANP